MSIRQYIAQNNKLPEVIRKTAYTSTFGTGYNIYYPQKPVEYPAGSMLVISFPTAAVTNIASLSMGTCDNTFRDFVIGNNGQIMAASDDKVLLIQLNAKYRRNITLQFSHPGFHNVSSSFACDNYEYSDYKQVYVTGRTFDSLTVMTTIGKDITIVKIHPFR